MFCVTRPVQHEEPVASGAMETRGGQREVERDGVKGPSDLGEMGQRPWVLSVWDRRCRSGGQPAGKDGCEGEGKCWW